MEKKLAIEVEQLKANYPDAEIQLWCEDEHRLGLKPVIRRVYVPSIGNTNSQCQLEIQVVMVVCIRTSQYRRNLLVDSSLRQYATF